MHIKEQTSEVSGKVIWMNRSGMISQIGRRVNYKCVALSQTNTLPTKERNLLSLGVLKRSLSFARRQQLFVIKIDVKKHRCRSRKSQIKSRTFVYTFFPRKGYLIGYPRTMR